MRRVAMGHGQNHPECAMTIGVSSSLTQPSGNPAWNNLAEMVRDD